MRELSGRPNTLRFVDFCGIFQKMPSFDAETASGLTLGTGRADNLRVCRTGLLPPGKGAPLGNDYLIEDRKKEPSV